MDINRFEEEYSQKLDNYINEYKNYLDNDDISDANLISRNQDLKDLTTKFLREINDKNSELDIQKKELDENKNEYEKLSAELESLKKTTDTNKNSLVMLKKKNKTLIIIIYQKTK